MEKLRKPNWVLFLKRVLPLLVALIVALTINLGLPGLKSAAAVWDRPPIDPEPIGNPPAFIPSANGFTWLVPPRFGMYGNNSALIDYHWDSVSMTYDQSYIYPNDWPMYFYGCQTQTDDDNPYTTANTYTWELDGKVFTGHTCLFRYENPGFSAQGEYTVKLTITDPAGNPVPAGKTPPYFQQQVYIKDYFIVSVGDSFASGQGNPDVRQFVMPLTPLPGWGSLSPPIWQDKRCNRSSYAGPARAAMDLEAADPHTTVTFISFACSGATLDTPTYAREVLQWELPFISLDPDINKPQGVGLLDKYIGLEPPDGVGYGEFNKYIPSQMSQVQTTLNPPTGKTARTIDSFLISIGGNDLHFAELIQACLLTGDCWTNAKIWDRPLGAGGSNWYLTDLVYYMLTPQDEGGSSTNLPEGYAKLNQAIQGLNPKPAKVYISQYPDLTRDDNGNFCRMVDDIFWPLDYAITPLESQRAANLALKGLNAAIQKAASDYGWKYVDGLASYEVDPNKPAGTPGLFVQGPDGKGHGYCASDNWIRRADESEVLQGPVNRRFLNQGTVHPTARGHQAYKERILYYMLPNLAFVPPGTLPTFTSSYTSNGLQDTPGANGWYTGSCAGSTCYPKVVLQVTANGSTPLTGASVVVNGQNGCSVNGVSCTTTVVSANNQVVWDFTFTGDGIYQLQFSARDTNSQVATYGSEIKVDLHDPVFTANGTGPYSVNEGDSLKLIALATDSSSGTLNYDWDLDEDGTYEKFDEQPSFSAASLDGPSSKVIGLRVTDEAGRSATTTATVNVNNVAPVLSKAAISPAAINEGASASLSGSISDAGSADGLTLTIDWGDGSTPEVVSLPAGSTSFSLSHIYADDNPTGTASDSYPVALSIADDDGATGTGSTSVVVNNLAPSVAITAPENGTLYAVNATVSLSATVTDPSSFDTLTSCSVNWNDGDTGAGSLAAGVCTASHAYKAPGVYTAQVTGTDDDTGAKTASVIVVVYDPSAGFVTGGGWITSPAGAYKADESLSGKATFGFVSRYQKGASIPSGNTAFKFDLAGMEFASTSYEWLVVNQGGTNAQFKGSGLINGAADPNGNAFKFMLWAGDGKSTNSADTFRIRIWWEDAAGEYDVYDNGAAQPIGSGNIVVHTGK